jgi:hypothetical protein
MLRFPIFASALFVALPLAHAGTLPAFDSEALCMDVAGTSARQELVMYGCMDFQDRMRKEISLRWDRLPVSVQDSCAKAAEPTGDYWKLKTCIDKEGRFESAEAPAH